MNKDVTMAKQVLINLQEVKIVIKLKICIINLINESRYLKGQISQHPSGSLKTNTQKRDQEKKFL